VLMVAEIGKNALVRAAPRGKHAFHAGDTTGWRGRRIPATRHTTGGSGVVRSALLLLLLPLD
jgi:hypothetical protein